MVGIESDVPYMSGSLENRLKQVLITGNFSFYVVIEAREFQILQIFII